MKLVAIDVLKRFLCALALATWSIPEPAAGEPVNLNLTCNGNRYLRDDPFPTPDSVSLSISRSSNPISVVLGKPGTDKIETGSVILNNNIKLKFVAGPYTGEYFYLTGALFLILKGERLTKLSCTLN